MHTQTKNPFCKSNLFWMMIINYLEIKSIHYCIDVRFTASTSCIKGRMIFHLSFHSERLVRRGGMLLEKHQAIGAGGWIGKFSNQSISILWPTHPQRAIKTVYVVGEENWFLCHKNWSGCNVMLRVIRFVSKGFLFSELAQGFWSGTERVLTS